jgi:hypothetical protein
MATDVPSAPTLFADQDSRTLNSIQLYFTAPIDNGGSVITGY